MIHKIDAIYENGVLQPIGPLAGLPEHSLVSVTIESAPGYAADFAGLYGVASGDAADDVTQFVEAEYARMNARKLN